MTAVPPALVGLGGNVGDVEEALRRACVLMGRIRGVVAVRLSSVLSTAPVGPIRHQPWFRNAVAELRFGAPAPTPRLLLAALLDIERRLGRDRSRAVAQGPRPIDLDLLCWGELVIDDPGPPALRLPHPRIGERWFVLRGLAELGAACGPGAATSSAGR